MIGTQDIILLSAALFCIGLIGVITRRSILMILLSVELMLSAANLAFVAFSRAQGDPTGQIMVFFVMIVAAVEVTVGLAIALVLMRLTHRVNADESKELRW